MLPEPEDAARARLRGVSAGGVRAFALLDPLLLRPRLPPREAARSEAPALRPRPPVCGLALADAPALRGGAPRDGFAVSEARGFARRDSSSSLSSHTLPRLAVLWRSDSLWPPDPRLLLSQLRTRSALLSLLDSAAEYREALPAFAAGRGPGLDVRASGPSAPWAPRVGPPGAGAGLAWGRVPFGWAAARLSVGGGWRWAVGLAAAAAGLDRPRSCSSSLRRSSSVSSILRAGGAVRCGAGFGFLSSSAGWGLAAFAGRAGRPASVA